MIKFIKKYRRRKLKKSHYLVYLLELKKKPRILKKNLILILSYLRYWFPRPKDCSKIKLLKKVVEI